MRLQKQSELITAFQTEQRLKQDFISTIKPGLGKTQINSNDIRNLSFEQLRHKTLVNLHKQKRNGAATRI